MADMKHQADIPIEVRIKSVPENILRKICNAVDPSTMKSEAEMWGSIATLAIANSPRTKLLKLLDTINLVLTTRR